MELADSGYNYEKYNITLEEQLPNVKETLNSLNNISNNIQSVNFQGVESLPALFPELLPVPASQPASQPKRVGRPSNFLKDVFEHGWRA